ncbi:MAG: NADH:ubiquinone oxidoreductase subunit A [Chloroflexi bacterium]|nr:NADH:ubiquinone oxidoreductase subunit A [Chloroflexota bacterium]|tara:strand:- start:5685 stop:6092 length:408 start_codon:yes stop_codon:yes gene_type:complete
MFEEYFRQYAILIIFSIVATSVPIGMLAISFIAQFIKVRPSRPSEVKLTAYEGGMLPFEERPEKFNFKYYYYAILFVVFDVEAVFLFPWAVRYGILTKQFGLVALLGILIFLLVATVGYFYAWKKKNLDWIYNEK